MVECRQAMARAEPAMVDIHGAVWSSPESYELVPSAERYEVYEMSFAAKVCLVVTDTYIPSVLLCMDIPSVYLCREISSAHL